MNTEAKSLVSPAQKLTKRYFLTLPEGYFVISNVFPFIKFITSPTAARAAQWQAIPKDVRYRLCHVHQNLSDAPGVIQRFVAHSDAMQGIHLTASNLGDVNGLLKSLASNNSNSSN